ncbi:DUF5050 domain-containing protein [Clostridium beijerinckii]|uniref:Prolow-density lipoprotein receptor-related protein 1-like beta-propeller domain-containing protein n=1 Tax=Clostridium beijerinckii TaxID=1520 RepID=A0A1S8S210_CLOBE|nr:DUF5050 domain-containing protein [Clostridium beijerinckii]NRY60666.1 hypothetical protein [Clostridium beijerinckii]OOM59285.1 hypothetical protein CLBCK_35840 [Clostridium beijerinckii]
MYKKLFFVTLISMLFIFSFTANAAESTPVTDIKKELSTNLAVKKETSTYPQTQKVNLAELLKYDTKNIVDYGEYVYYINNNDNSSIYRMKKDNSENTRIISFSKCDNLNIVGNYIYFTSKSDNCLYKASISDYNPIKVLNVENYNKLTIYKDLIYYIGKDYFLHAVNLNGEGDKIISKETINTYWIYDNSIYCQLWSRETKNVETDALYKINLNGGEKEEFLKSNKENHFEYSDIKFIDGYVYLVTGDHYCYRAKLSDTDSIEKLDIEDTSVDISLDKKTWYKCEYNKLSCIEGDGTKEFQADLPKTKILDVDENYIYFIDYGENICRIKKDGTGEEVISKTDKEIYGDVNTKTIAYDHQISKDYIYYMRSGSKQSGDKLMGVENLAKVKKDGTEDTILQNNYTSNLPPEVEYNNKLYGIVWKSPYYNIIEIGADYNSDKVLAEDCSSEIHLVDGWIYYFSDNTLKRVTPDGSKKENVIEFKKSVIDKNRQALSYFYGDYFYCVESPDNRLQIWRKDLKNNGEYQYFMTALGTPNIKGVDDKYIYYINQISTWGNLRFEIYKADLETHKSTLLYTTPDISNFECLGIMNGKFYFTRTIHEVKSLG